jgi:hypothetical protein
LVLVVVPFFGFIVLFLFFLFFLQFFQFAPSFTVDWLVLWANRDNEQLDSS